MITEENISFDRGFDTGFKARTSNLDLTREQIDLLKCEFCDDHLKRRFLEMKENFFKIFSNYLKFSKPIKTKDMSVITRLVEETGNAQKLFLHYKELLEKLITHRVKLKLNTNNRYIPVNTYITISDQNSRFRRKRKERIF